MYVLLVMRRRLGFLSVAEFDVTSAMYVFDPAHCKAPCGK